MRSSPLPWAWADAAEMKLTISAMAVTTMALMARSLSARQMERGGTSSTESSVATGFMREFLGAKTLGKAVPLPRAGGFEKRDGDGSG
jgi:hypothetical protein